MRFQSTPGIAAGRISRSCLPNCRCNCFNPRPALLPGESVVRSSLNCFHAVSIHARHCCRANLFQASVNTCLQMVSIHARHCCRANPPCRRWKTAGCCFNPRPALLPGESSLASKARWITRVSIHARHCCRANPGSADQCRALIRVSIHARHCCRANPDNLRLARAGCGVSIHARHCCRANRQKMRSIRSAPPRVSIHARHCCRANPGNATAVANATLVSIHARHCCRANREGGVITLFIIWFQSTPGIAAGRIQLRQGRGGRVHVVSIHARHCCRANPLRRKSPATARGCFNPRPALLPGESSSSLVNREAMAVSIHARHCCRANRTTRSLRRSIWKFQSTPGIAAGRIPLTPVAAAVTVMFQSTPGIAAGRIRRWGWRAAVQCRGFNPRPALLPGESGALPSWVE